MNILIIGSTGALGRELLNIIIKSNVDRYNIHVLNKINNSEGAINHNFDISDLYSLELLIKRIKPEIIFNLASILQGNINDLISVNLTPSIKIIETVKEIGLNTRIILIGSAAEYGINIANNKIPFSETSELNPVTPYGLSKALQSNLLHYYKHIGLDLIYMRVFNLYGEGISENLFDGALRKKINLFINKKINYIEVENLNNYRDFISTKKASEMIFQLAIYGKSGEIYNVGSGYARSLKDHLLNVLNEFGLDLNSVKINDKILNIHKKNYIESNNTYSCANMNKTSNLLLNLQ